MVRFLRHLNSHGTHCLRLEGIRLLNVAENGTVRVGFCVFPQATLAGMFTSQSPGPPAIYDDDGWGLELRPQRS